jgi:hypothetical protein
MKLLRALMLFALLGSAHAAEPGKVREYNDKLMKGPERSVESAITCVRNRRMHNAACVGLARLERVGGTRCGNCILLFQQYRVLVAT